MRIAGGFLLISSLALCQTRPEFDVVDVKPNVSTEVEGSGSILPGGQFRAINIPIKEVIKFAFGARDETVVGAPSWTTAEHYDIVGRAAPVGSEETFWRSTRAVTLMRLGYNWDDTFRQMAQTMLADRFKLSFHREQKVMSVFALEVAKGGQKFQPAADPAAKPNCTRSVGEGLVARAACTSVTMRDLGQALQGLAELYVDRDVVDQTGLDGEYDLNLEWVGRTALENGSAGLTLPDALEKQAGLRLERKSVAMPVIVIDHIEKPASN